MLKISAKMKRKVIISISLGALVALSGTGFASTEFYSGDVYSDQFQTLQTVELYEIRTDHKGDKVEVLKEQRALPTNLDTIIQETSQNKRGQGLGEILMATKDLIALGERVYKIIKKGKPVLKIDSKPISVLPKDPKGDHMDAFALTNWRAPKGRRYKVVAKNYLGLAPVSFEFLMIYTYGGQYNGKGAYLTGAQIKPTGVEVSWGYSLDAAFSVETITNQGTSESPVAAAILNIDYKIKTMMKESRHSRSFMVNGLGDSQAY